MRVALYELRGGPDGLFLDERVVGEATKYLFEEDAALHQSHVIAEAAVVGVAEGEDSLRISVDVEAIGIVELGRIPIRRREEHDHRLPLLKLVAAQLEVAGHGASQPLRRRVETQYFHQCCGNQGRVRTDLTSLIRVTPTCYGVSNSKNPGCWI